MYQKVKDLCEKNNISYGETIDIGYKENTLDKVVYKEIVNNLDHIGLTEKELLSFEIMNNYYDGVICIDNVFNI